MLLVARCMRWRSEWYTYRTSDSTQQPSTLSNSSGLTSRARSFRASRPTTWASSMATRSSRFHQTSLLSLQANPAPSNQWSPTTGDAWVSNSTWNTLPNSQVPTNFGFRATTLRSGMEVFIMGHRRLGGVRGIRGVCWSWGRWRGGSCMRMAGWGCEEKRVF